jgi:hypothetical protein
MNLTAIARRLGAKRQGQNWRAPCPLGCGYKLSLAEGEDGRLLCSCKGGHEYAEIELALVKYGLLDDDAGDELHVDNRRCVDAHHRDDAKRIAHARQIYASGVWDERITVYLRSRQISLTASCFRFSPEAPHRLGGKLPALIAPIVNISGDLTGVHMTYLRRDGAGKAALPKDYQRECRGLIRGGAIRLGEHDPDYGLLVGASDDGKSGGLGTAAE